MEGKVELYEKNFIVGKKMAGIVNLRKVFKDLVTYTSMKLPEN